MILAVPLTLASAALSGGAQLASAGGGLPQRITMADDKFFAPTGMVATSGIVMDPGGLHFWVCLAASVIKVRISDGATITTFTGNASDGGTRNITAPFAITRKGTKLYFVCNNATVGVAWIGEIDTVGVTCRLYSQTIASPVFGVSPSAGTFWLRPTNTGNATFTEFTLAGTGDAAAATASGRTIANGWGMSGDGGNDVYLYYSNGTTIVRYKLADASTTLLTIPGSSLTASLPGYGIVRGNIWDKSLAVPVMWGTAEEWTRVLADLSAISGRAYGFSEFASIIVQPSTLTPAMVDWSDDLAQMAFQTYQSAAAATSLANVRLKNIAVQRARWSWTATLPTSLKKITIPGDLAARRGGFTNMPTPAYLQVVYDHRPARVYYAINGGARTEYQGGDISVALVVGDVLTVDVDMQWSSSIPSGPVPWVAGDSAEGILLTVSIPEPRRRLAGSL